MDRSHNENLENEGLEDGMVMNSPKKSELTRRRILTTTSELFRLNGYQTTSMRDIATATEMKSGSLYYYFESKEALLATILNHNIDAALTQMKDAVAALPENATTKQKLHTAIAVACKTMAEDGDMAIASARILSYLKEPAYSEQVRHRQAYNFFWQNLLEEGVKNAEIQLSAPPSVISMAIVGAIAYLGEWFDPKRSAMETVGEAFTNLFFSGLGSRSAVTKPRRKGKSVIKCK
jgi:AcrR family transcriptional regulator